jgi:hypothetical protein
LYVCTYGCNILFARTYFDDNAFSTFVYNYLFRFSTMTAFLFAFALTIRLAFGLGFRLAFRLAIRLAVSFRFTMFAAAVRFTAFITLFTFWFFANGALFPRTRRGFATTLAAFMHVMRGRVVRCL